jgi:3-oxoacyl-[acyl-carrier protein] reductase
MQLGLEGKVAAVGGSTRGIGKACAKALLAQGARVSICGRDDERLAETCKELEEEGEVVGAVADLATVAGVDAFLDSTRCRLGPPDILVSNTGGPPAGELDDFGDDAWRQASELLLLSAVRLARSAAADMKEKGWGRILFVTSIAVKQPLPNMVLSNTLRSAVTALAKSLARQLAAHSITVNCVCPGYTATQRVTELAASLARQQATAPDRIMEKWKASIPAGRLADPAEIGEVVAFLASKKASYVNGVSLPVDGGWTQCLL